MKKVRIVEKFGFTGFRGEYRGKTVWVFDSPLSQGFSSVKVEEFFLDEEVDVVVNLNKCYSIKHSKLGRGNPVIIDEVASKSIHEEDELEYIRLDKDVREAALIGAEELKMKTTVSRCFSASNISGSDDVFFDDFECFDSVSFSLYDMAKRYEKKSISLCLNLDPHYFDIHHYLLEKEGFEYDSVFKLALEFSLR